MSAETAALVRYMVDSGVPHRVTSVLRPNAITKAGYPSRHAVGLAVDFCGPRPGRDTAELAEIFLALARVAHQLHELIYAGPQVSKNVKAGKWVPKYAVSGHHDHVHVSVARGVIVKWPGPTLAQQRAAPQPPKVAPMYNPPITVTGKVVATLPAPGGGVWMLTDIGAIYAWHCDDKGSPNRHPEYWDRRVAARLEPHGTGYAVVDSDGNRYEYP